MSSDVVEAEATSTTEADATAEKPVVAAQPQEADAAKQGTQKPETKVAAKTEAAPKTDASKDVKGEAKPAESEAEPVELVFKTPEGAVIDDPATKAFASIANEHKWTPDIANRERDRLLAGMGEAKKAMAAAWEKELRADKEFGGAKFDENVGLIKTTLEKLGDVGVAAQKFLVETGLEREPRIARLLHAFGKAISPDKFTAGVSVPGRPGDIPNPNDTSVARFSQVYAKSPTPQQ